MRGEDDVNGFTAAIRSMDQSNEGALGILLTRCAGAPMLPDLVFWAMSVKCFSSGLGVSLHLSTVALLPDVECIWGRAQLLYKSNALAIATIKLTQYAAQRRVGRASGSTRHGRLTGRSAPDCATMCYGAATSGLSAAAAIGELCTRSSGSLPKRYLLCFAVFARTKKTCNGWSN